MKMPAEWSRRAKAEPLTEGYDMYDTQGASISLGAVDTNPADSRVEAMREFARLEDELLELRGMQGRTAEQIEKAQFRRRELVAHLHEIIDGPVEAVMAARA